MHKFYNYQLIIGNYFVTNSINMYTKTFVNEVDNEITIKSKCKKGEGTNHKTGEKINYDGIEFSLIRPTGILVNHITINEAFELCNAIDKQLEIYLSSLN